MESNVNVQMAPPAADAETVKITLDRRVSPGGSVFFSQASDAQGWPLMERLFKVGAVHSVLAKENVLIVAKTSVGSWDAVMPELESAIQDHYGAHPDTDERLARPESGAGDEGSIRQRVQEILDTEVNPSIASHGGFIRLVDVQGTRVVLQMGGGCQGCGMAHVTLREGVEHMLRSRIPEITEIVDHTDHAAGADPFYAR
jgi:Fe-S cluster biogenesis protein NfuA